MKSSQPLRLLVPPVRQWVERTFGALTPPQRTAIPAIHAGKNVLISAPTGTGKTLAAFLSILSELIRDHLQGTLTSSIHAVYISPLRALGYDIQRNLQEPLHDICAPLSDDRDNPCIRVATRTGDTTPTDRRKLLTSPPHILVTTPESLAILLSTPSFRPHFSSVRWIIVDEVHAIAGNKRGTHLTLSLERLAYAATQDPIRIGLSATVAPLDQIARWLVGPTRSAHAISWTTSRAATFSVTSVLSGDVVPNPQTVQRVVAETVSEHVKRNRTTLIFTNTRGATERLAHRLITKFGEERIAAHHSSLAREARLHVEEQLREGHLDAVVSSTSLELGIDIGTIDETVLVSSPRDVTRALQRIGRSGHRIDRHPAGVFISTGVDDFLECAVVQERCAAGQLDPIRPPAAPLDVLAQQLIGMSAEGDWEESAAYDLIKRASPYMNLPREDFDAILDYLAETDEALEERRVYAKIERTNGVFRARSRSVQTIFYQNVGTITGGASVRVKPRGTQTVIGTTEEDFIEHLKPGDRFLLGGRVWSFMFAQGMTAFVSPAAGRPSVPRWASEILPATPGVARGVGELRMWMRDQYLQSGEPGLTQRIIERFSINVEDAEAIAHYIGTQQTLSPIPDTDELLIERWPDSEDERVVIHAMTSPLGRRANDALAHVIAYRGGKSVGVLVDDQAFALRVPTRSRWHTEEIRTLFSPDNFAQDLRQALARSDMLARRFRQVSAIGLMLVKNYRGRSKFIGGMQHNARKIWYLLERTRPTFPLIRETYRTVLEDDLDIETALAWLTTVHRRITVRDIAVPPPFLFRLLTAGTTDSMLLEERDTFLRRLWEQARSANPHETLD